MTKFEELPYVYQIENLVCARWWAETGIQTSFQQLEDDVKQEALRIWNEERYELNNVLRNLTPNNSRRNTVATILNRDIQYKRTSRFGGGVDNAYRVDNGKWMPLMNEVYQKQVDKNQQLQTQLAQLQQQNQALQNQVDELNEVINGTPRGETETRVEQPTTNLPPNK